jgi:hypothetical protein
MIKKIEEFLKEKPGYLKKGPKVLQGIIFNQLNLKVSKSDCWIATVNVKTAIKKEVKKDYKILIYDIETSYNLVSAWRVGYNITLPHYSVVKEREIICVSYKWVGEDEVYNLSWDKNQSDKFLLEQFIEVMNEADLLVAHNGDRFDLKWIRTRALKHGLQMLPFYPQHDTLKTAKRYFNFNSNKLDYIASFLGFEGKIATTHELWDDIILRKDPDALIEMIVYCDEDVRQLEKVYLKLRDWDKPKQHVGVLNGLDRTTSPLTGTKKLELVKTRTTGGGTIKRIMKDLDTGGLFEMSDANYKKWLKNK